jgi:DNA-binding XRE family transcriptional regulator
MALVTGNQLKAARSLVDIEQQELADAASVHVNTIRKMEAKGWSELTSAADVVRRVQTTLERLGVEFLDGDHPGVRLRPGAKPSTKKASTKKAKPVAKSRRRNGPQGGRGERRGGFPEASLVPAV